MQVTVVLRARGAGKKVKPLEKLIASGERLTRTQYAARYGADPKDVKQVQAFARAHGLKVSSVNRGARTVVLSGPAAAFNKAFQVDLAHYEGPQGTYRGRTGSVYIPAGLKGVILAVHGLDNRPHARPHFRVASNAPRHAQPPRQRQGLYLGLLHAAPGGAVLRLSRPAPTARARPSASSSWAAATRSPT